MIPTLPSLSPSTSRVLLRSWGRSALQMVHRPYALDLEVEVFKGKGMRGLLNAFYAALRKSGAKIQPGRYRIRIERIPTPKDAPR